MLASILSGLNDFFLKMTWLSELVKWLLEDIFALSVSTPVGASVHFFIYDVMKIFILLTVLIYSLSYIQSYFPPERTRHILGKMNGIGANIMGALLGTVTPFCSCSSIPLFIGFTKAGLPLGVTFSFLISSPLVDLASIILLASIFNWKVAFVYVALGLLLAVLGGTLISALGMRDQVADFIQVDTNSIEAYNPEDHVMTKRERHAFALDQVKDIVHKVWLYILIGVGLGAVLAFMMAVTALSLPSLLLLKQVVKNKLLFTFFGIVAIGILIIGYSLNAVSNWLV